ncbi:lysophospholipid acyltransferase family protein [Nibrella saemangeumensis]|uniref:Lysophospholipid acyltransferase family protein n=1 Tax=Nibrella saemangeumensis TaxID=1084526 RepID=A0ABP8MUP6_9BACT
MRFLTLLYSLWCVFWFVGLFLLLFPFFYLFLQREEWKPYAHWLNRFWGQLFFPMVGISFKVEYRYRPEPKRVYVFCANHFSYLDIACMGVILNNYYAFVGKSDLKKVPLFGYMFAKLHIQVDRNISNSRAYSLAKSLRTLASGRSVVIFPEGGIITNDPPKMHYPFKDGAFTMAIQQQVPIVPISLLNNYMILPDKKEMRMHRMPLRAIVHPPIETKGLTQADIGWLKEETYRIIDSELSKQQIPEKS